MGFQSQDKVQRVRAMLRANFIVGLPRSGASILSALLKQNPRFMAPGTSAALGLFEQSLAQFANDDPLSRILDGGQINAIRRSTIDVIYHDRNLDSVLFDGNRGWLNHLDILTEIFPLCRFIICVRNPAEIVNSMEIDGDARRAASDASDLDARIAALTDGDGYLGFPIAQLRHALGTRHSERMIVIDYERIVGDAEEVIDVLYDFLRETPFDHDFDELSLRVPPWYEPEWAVERVISGPVRRTGKETVLPLKTIQQLSGKAFWRNLRKTGATLMLGTS